MAEMTDEQAARKNRNFMLHVLRNPYGWGDDVVREIRLKAADELERLISTGHNDSLLNDEWLWEWAKHSLPILEMTAHEVSEAMRNKAKERLNSPA